MRRFNACSAHFVPVDLPDFQERVAADPPLLGPLDEELEQFCRDLRIRQGPVRTSVVEPQELAKVG